VEWVEEGAQGQHRFIGRIWRLFEELSEPLNGIITDSKIENFSALTKQNQELVRSFHNSLKSITHDLDPKRNGFNTSIARMSESINALQKYVNEHKSYTEEDKICLQHCLFNFLKMMAPFTPHLAEELWYDYVIQEEPDEAMTQSIHREDWPKFESSYLETDTYNLVLQFKGKKVDVLEVSKTLSKEDIEKLALDNDKMKNRLEGLDIKKVIVVPNKLVNVVAV